MEDIFEDLEILILQNEDDFDRGSGKFILRKFIKEKQAKQLTLTDVSQQREQLFDFYKEMKRFGKLYNDNYTEEKMMQDISDFIKNK